MLHYCYYRVLLNVTCAQVLLDRPLTTASICSHPPVSSLHPWSMSSQFVEANLACFSREGLRYALEQQPSAVRQRLLDAHKAVLGAVAASTREGAAAAEVAAPHAEAPPTAKRKRRA